MTETLRATLVGYSGALTAVLALKGFIIPSIVMGYITYLMLED